MRVLALMILALATPALADTPPAGSDEPPPADAGTAPAATPPPAANPDTAQQPAPAAPSAPDAAPPAPPPAAPPASTDAAAPTPPAAPPAADAAAAPPAPPPPDAPPQWLAVPNQDDYAANYPDKAARLGVAGGADLLCIVGPDGSMTACKITAEDPKGLGFGDAALQLAKLFKLSPTTGAGASTAGRQLTLPIRFAPPG